MKRNRFMLVGVLVASLAIGSLALATVSLARENENKNENGNATVNVNVTVNANSNSNTNSSSDDSAELSHWRGTLTGMSGIALPATLTLQVDTTTYTVNVGSETKIVRKYNGRSSLEEFAIGDSIRVWGTKAGTVLTASKLKDYSIQRIGGTFAGTIGSIDTTGQTFVLDVKHRDDQTIQVVASTKVFQGNRAGSFSDLAVGQTVRVIGVWRKSADTVRADRILIKLTEINGTIGAVDCTSNTFTVNSKGGMFGSSSLKLLTGGTTKTWTVTITDATILRDKELDPLTCADLKANHKVSVRGLRTSSTALNALQVVDKGAKKTPKTITGTISDVNTGSMTFTVTKSNSSSQGNTTYAVSATPETLYVDSTGVAITFASLANGHRVSVWGTLTGDQFIANLVIDKDLPVE